MSILRCVAEVPVPEENHSNEPCAHRREGKLTVLRRLQGITYWVAEDPDEIRDFVNTSLRREWEADLKEDGRNAGEDNWLRTLPSRRWRLEIIEAVKVMLNPEIMNFFDERRNYSFQDSLAKRGKELRTVLETFGGVIWPVVVTDDMVLVDGDCRFTTLRGMGISQVYAYVGALYDD